MWYAWSTLLLVSCALAEEVGAGSEVPPVSTTRAPPRTLDRQAYELAWRSWLQSPESGNQNAPPRRITTKSLFITPLVCPKGQRLDRNGCVQVVTVNKEEHERILLDQLNALFTSAPSGDILYDYGDEEPGPLQLSIPIGLDPLAAPLQGQEPYAQALENQPNYVKIDKKDENASNDAGIEAELELLKLQNSQNTNNDTGSSETTNVLNHNVLSNLLPYPEKPKRDSPLVNASEIEAITNATDEGQKELVFGHVNVDPVIYYTEDQNQESSNTEKNIDSPDAHSNSTLSNVNNTTDSTSTMNSSNTHYNKTGTDNSAQVTTQILKKEGDQTKLNPENDYSDIGEAIKLISRYAEVTTDDNFTKDQKKFTTKDDSILGTRTKLQHRRNKPKPQQASVDLTFKEPLPSLSVYTKNEPYYRYPWPSQHSQTPPPNYPFRHLQDYWPNRKPIGGLYNSVHENPRRHHHSYPHNYFRPYGNSNIGYSSQDPAMPEVYPGPLQENPLRVTQQHHGSPMRSHTNNQDLYSLLGLRHWFSSEGTSKR